MKYQVLTHTICQGWVNCWTIDDEPQTFDTAEEAQAEIDAFLADVEADIGHGRMPPDAGYARDDFMVALVEEGPSHE